MYLFIYFKQSFRFCLFCAPFQSSANHQYGFMSCSFMPFKNTILVRVEESDSQRYTYTSTIVMTKWDVERRCCFGFCVFLFCDWLESITQKLKHTMLKCIIISCNVCTNFCCCTIHDVFRARNMKQVKIFICSINKNKFLFFIFIFSNSF